MLARGVLRVASAHGLLTQGVHSGDASGIVPDTFRISRSLLSRIEDEDSGQVKLKELCAFPASSC